MKNILRDQAAVEIGNTELENEKTPSVSAAMSEPVRRTTAPKNLSASSSTVSNDAYNERGLQSRRNSTSTVATADSEASNQTLGSVCLATLANNHLKHNVKLTTDTITTDRHSGDAIDQDLKAGHSCAKRGKGSSPPSYLAHASETPDPLHTAGGSPSLGTNPSSSLEASTTNFDEVATHQESKKRTADDLADSNSRHKKLKSDSKKAATNPTIKTTSDVAMAVATKKDEE